MAVVDYLGAALGLGGIVLGLVFVLSGVQHALDARRMSAVDVTPVEDVEPGPVAIEGTVRPAGEEALDAPFTDRKCVVHEYTVREVTGDGTNTPDEIGGGEERVPFYVEDATGRVLVRPDDAKLEIDEEERVSVGRDEDPPEPIRRFLSSADDIGEPAEPAVEGLRPTLGTRKFRESLLEVGEDAYVFGKATHAESAEFGETDVEIGEGAAGGHSNPTTFVLADGSKADLESGYASGGRLSVVIGAVLVAVGSAMLSATPFV